MAGMEIDHLHTSGVDDTTLQAHISRISSYRDELKEVVSGKSYNSPESALSLPDDADLLQTLEEVHNQLSGDNLTDVIVVGMGGSARGARAVYDLVADNESANLHTIDTVGGRHITDVVAALRTSAERVDQIAICVVSKSGKTTETIANTNVLLEKLGDVFGREEVYQQTVVVSQPGSQLQQEAKESGISTVDIPGQISGRFSIFSAAGLLPLKLAGVNVRDLAGGAKSLREACLSGRPTSDPAAALAAIIYTHMEESTRILNHFFFNPQANSFGGWAKQLFAESLGKRRNRRGEPVFSGLYPVTTIGPNDLHADFQLQLGGPKNFLTLFVRERDTSGDLQHRISDQGLLPEAVRHVEGASLGDLHTALCEATIQTFREDDRPFVEISVPTFDTTRVGQLLLLEELVVMYLGHLLDINTFNQPQVEKYKDITRDKLDNQ